MEGDLKEMYVILGQVDFYPRPPHGGRHSKLEYRRISTDFYPRPPHGGRHDTGLTAAKKFIFLPTPSAWRATNVKTMSVTISQISTHALRMEGDSTP